MSWQGEPEFSEFFGLRGFKCLVILLMDEVNILRAKHGLAPRTLPQFINQMKTKMGDHSSDDDGPEPN